MSQTTHRTKKQMRAGIYVRVSKNRDDDAAKPERQIERCRLHVASRQHVEVGLYLDDDVSAFRGETERPMFDQLIRDIEDGEVDVVVTLHMDRLLRSNREMLDFIDLAKATGVKLQGVESPELDLETSTGRVVAQLLSSLSEAEVERKSERQLLRNEYAAANGEVIGGQVPFGWGEIVQKRDKDGHFLFWTGDHKPTIEDTGLPIMTRINGEKINESEAQLIRVGLERVIEDGNVSLSQIARDWNEAGARTWFFREWDQNKVRKALMRPRNAGLVRFRGEVVDGVDGRWERIVNPDTWRTAVSILSARTKRFVPRTHLLTSLLTCGRCGSLLTSDRATQKVKGKTYSYRYYKCRAGAGCSQSIRVTTADRMVRRHVRDRLTFGDASALAPKSWDLDKAAALRAERAALIGKMSDLEDLWSAGEFSTTGYRKQRSVMQATVDEVERRLVKIEQSNAFAAMLADRVGVHEDVIRRGTQVGERFDALELDQRRLIVSTLFPEIIVSPGRGEGRIALYLPDGRQYLIGGDTETWPEDPFPSAT